MRLLLIDDHPLFSASLAHALTRVDAGIVVGTSRSVDEGLLLVQRGMAPELVVIDYRLDADDGVQGLRRFAQALPGTPLALVSGEPEAGLAQRARAAGARGLLLKAMPFEAFVQALHRLHEGGEVFDGAEAAPEAGALAVWPTPRQIEVLSLIARGEPNKRIARELGITERTVKLHVSALLDALGAQNRTHLLVRAREFGLL